MNLRSRPQPPRRWTFTAVGATAALLALATPAGASACGTTPRDAVVRYYHAVNAKHYRTAWSCLRTATRTSFGGYTKWKAGYSKTRYTHIRTARTTDQGAGLGHVKFVIDTCRVSGGSAAIERIGGTWFAEDGYAGWRIGQPHAHIASNAQPRTADPRCYRAAACEHLFVSIKGSPYGRFRRSLEIGRLPMVLAAAAELPRLELDDALEVLVLMADQSPSDPYAAAAARWCGRLAVERGIGLTELRLAVAACELLPHEPAGVRVLRALYTRQR